jgi:hypothetical protein
VRHVRTPPQKRERSDGNALIWIDFSLAPQKQAASHLLRSNINSPLKLRASFITSSKLKSNNTAPRHHMKTVYLHIGGFKTGSSAIQKYCSDHREVLLQAGLHYLQTARPASNRTTHSLLPLSLYQSLGKRTPSWYANTDSYRDVADAVRTELDKSDADRFLISSEEFYRLVIFDQATQTSISQQLQSLFKGYNLKVIMYARPPVDFIASWYNQANKDPVPVKRFIDFFADINGTLTTPSHNVKFWRNCFGPDCMRILPYQRNGHDHIRNFLVNVNTPLEEGFLGEAEEVNPGIDPLALERKRLARVYSMVDPKNQSKFLKTNALSSHDSITKLQGKMDRINTSYRYFCKTEHIPHPDRELSLTELLTLSEKINRGDAMTPRPSASARNLAMRDILPGSVIRRVKRWLG